MVDAPGYTCHINLDEYHICALCALIFAIRCTITTIISKEDFHRKLHENKIYNILYGKQETYC